MRISTLGLYVFHRSQSMVCWGFAKSAALIFEGYETYSKTWNQRCFEGLGASVGLLFVGKKIEANILQSKVLWGFGGFCRIDSLRQENYSKICNQRCLGSSGACAALH